MLRNIFKKIKENYHYIILVVFFILQLRLHAFVYLYGDDYYYASYFKDGLKGFIELTKIHYMQVNGRAFIHMLDEFMLFSGIGIWRIFNPMVISVIVVTIAKIASSYYKINKAINEEKLKIKAFYKKSLVISILLFSMLNIWITRQSVYWATGSFNYLFPVMLLMLFFYLYKKDVYNGIKSKWLFLLAFFSAFTVEQAGFVVIFINIYILFDIWLKKNKISKVYIINFIFSIIAYATVVFAPGNSVRTTYYTEFYENSLFTNIMNNTFSILDTIFFHEGIYIFAMLMILYIIFVTLNSKPSSRIGKLFRLGLPSVSSVVLIAYIDAITTDALRIANTKILREALSLTLALYFVYFLYLSFLKYTREKNGDLFFFVLMCLFTQGMMVISPIFGPRNILICGLCLFVPLTYYIVKYSNDKIFLALIAITLMTGLLNWPNYLIIAFLLFAIIASKHLNDRQVRIFIAIVCILLSFKYFDKNIQGYKENVEIHEYNAEQVERYKISNSTEELKLRYLNNEVYKWTMPYDDPYHMKRYKILYDLGIETQIKFE